MEDVKNLKIIWDDSEFTCSVVGSTLTQSNLCPALLKIEASGIRCRDCILYCIADCSHTAGKSLLAFRDDIAWRETKLCQQTFDGESAPRHVSGYWTYSFSSLSRPGTADRPVIYPQAHKFVRSESQCSRLTFTACTPSYRDNHVVAHKILRQYKMCVSITNKYGLPRNITS